MSDNWSFVVIGAMVLGTFITLALIGESCEATRERVQCASRATKPEECWKVEP